MPTPEEFLQDMKRVQALQEQERQKQDDAQKELQELDFYQTAASAGDDRDTSHMKDVERLLITGDVDGLQALVGNQQAARLQAIYEANRRKVESDAGAELSPLQAVGGTATGLLSDALNVGMNMGTAATGIFSPEYAARGAKLTDQFNKIVNEEVLPEAYTRRQQVVDASNAAEMQDHAAQAAAEGEQAAKNDSIAESSLAWSKAGALDFGTGMSSVVKDPVVGSRQFIGTAASMIATATAGGALRKIGQYGLQKVASSVIKREVKKGVAEEIAKEVGEQTIKNASKLVNGLAFPIASAAAEGSGAYQEATMEVLNRSPEELMKTSVEYRQRVEELMKTSVKYRQRVEELQLKGASLADAQQTAQWELARKVALISGGATAATTAALAGTIGRVGEDPLHLVRGKVADVAFEGLDETTQGLSSALYKNQAVQAFVDPSQESTKGAAFQGGQGLALSVGSTGLLKAPAIVGAVGQSAGQGITTRAAKVRAKVAAESPTTTENLTKQADTLSVDTSKAEKLNQAVASIDPASPAAPVVAELANSTKITTLPEQHATLSPENQAKFTEGQNRVEAVTTAAELLKTEKNEAEQVKLALTLEELMEPVDRLSKPQEELNDLGKNAEAMEIVGEYQDVLNGIQNMPEVQEASVKVKEVLGKAVENAPELTVESLATPEGLETAKLIAVQATLEPGIGSTTTAKSMEVLLEQNEKGTQRLLTDAQQRALKGSLALLKSREALEDKRLADAAKRASEVLGKDATKELTDRHFLRKNYFSKTERVGTQATVETDLKGMFKGGYSARVHTDRIVKAMTAGDVKSAKAWAKDFSLFVEHFQNKVGALNKSAAKNGSRVSYDQLVTINGKRQWMDSRTNPNPYDYKDLFLDEKKSESVANAQVVDTEAALLFNILNGLSQAYPELDIKLPAQQRLHERVQALDPTMLPRSKKGQAKAEKKVSEPVAKPKEKATPVAAAPVEKASVKAPEKSEVQVVNALLEKNLVSKNEVKAEIIAAAKPEPKSESKPAVKPVKPVKKVQEAVKTAPVVKPEIKEAPAPKVAPQVVQEKVVKQNDTSAKTDLKAVPTKVVELHPRLLNGKVAANRLLSSFNIKLVDGKLSTRLMDQDEPVEVLNEALSSEENFKEFMGDKKPSHKLTSSVIHAYARLLSDNPKTRSIGSVIAAMETQLNEFLDGTWTDPSKGKGPNGKAIKSPIRELLKKDRVAFGDSVMGKPLNFVETNESGELVYNRPLLQQAALAAMQWAITASQRTVSNNEESLAALAGVENFEDLRPDIQNRIAKGESLLEAKTSLASHLGRFLGLKAKKDAGIGFSESVLEAMAAELLRAMETTGLLTVDTINFKQEQPDLIMSNPDKTVNRYIVEEMDDNEGIYQYPSLLEESVLLEAEPTAFYADDKVPVPTHQMGNPNIELAPETQEAIKNLSAQEYLLNMPMVDAVTNLGTKEDLTAIFGNDLPDNKEDQVKYYNKNTLDSMLGQNASLTGAFTEINRILGEMKNVLQEKGSKYTLETLGKKYQYAVTSVNRIMMLGAHNPQANKLMREIMMSTWSTLDLSGDPETNLKNNKQYQHMMLAVAQALGQKIHKDTLEANAAWAHTQITTTLAPAIDILIKWLGEREAGNTTSPLKALKVELDKTGMPVTPIAVMVLMEVARMKQAKPEDLKAFRTPIYLESDGMTNGPFNSIGLFSLGEFDAEQILNMARGGVTISKTPRTADSISKELKAQQSPGDIYEAGVFKGKVEVLNNLAQIRQQLDKNGKTKSQGEKVYKVAEHLLTAMSSLLDGEVVWETDSSGKKTLNLKRGIGKNPITILVYGSGNKGISNKITRRMVDAFYEKLTVITRNPGLKKWEVAQKMFPKAKTAVEAVQQFDAIIEAMGVLSQERSYRSKSGRFGLAWETTGKFTRAENPPTDRLDRVNGYQQFTFTTAEFQRIQANMRVLFVNPMVEGIKQSMGKSVFESTKLLIQSCKMQALVARELYYKMILDKVEEKAKKLERTLKLSAKEAQQRASSEFLSREELNKIWDSLANVMPIVKSDKQVFLATKTSLLQFWENKKDEHGRVTESAVDNKFEISRALNGNLRTPVGVKAPADPGVAPIPYFAIGMGDARMVREIFQTALQNSIEVYDGINIPVGKIDEYGERINKAALHAWQGNVFADISETFERFTSDKRVRELLKDPEIAFKLSTAFIDEEELLNPRSLNSESPALALEEVMGDIKSGLHMSAMQVKARQMALAKYPISIDQMSGTYHPYVRDGANNIPEGATPEDIAKLLTAAYHEALGQLVGYTSTPVVKEAAVDVTGVQILTAESIKSSKLLAGLNQHEQKLVKELLDSDAIKYTKIVIGNAAQVATYQGYTGETSLAEVKKNSPLKDIKGFYSTNENAVYILSSDAETVVHELVHAATYSTISAYYNNQKIDLNAKNAVRRLEQLMQLMLNQELDIENPDSSADVSIRLAKEAIAQYMPFDKNATAANKAAALNEFMSWALSNRELAKRLSSKTISSLPAAAQRLIRIGQAVYKAIRQALWGDKAVSAQADDVLSNITFNTAVIAKTAPTLTERIKAVTLMHSILSNDGNVRLQEIQENYLRKVASHLGQTYTPEWARNIEQNAALEKAIDISAELANAVSANTFFPMSQEAKHAFQMMILAFATEAKIDSHAMMKAQGIYEQLLKTLTQDDFLTNTGDPANDALQAQNKFEFITGHDVRMKDASGRSTILPAFIALATVNDEFRALLAKKSMPDSTTKKIVGIDTAIDKVSDGLLNKLSDHLAGVNKPVTMQMAIDQLHQNLTRNVLEQQTWLENKLEAFNNTVNNGINGKIVNMMQRMGSAANNKADAWQQSNSKVAHALSAALKTFSVFVSEKDSAAIRESVVAKMDRHPATYNWAQELVSDITGRLESQAPIYDEVKKTRTFVAQTRQAYRDTVPTIIESKFKQKLNQDQHNMLYHYMGRNDMAGLLDSGMTVKQVLELASDSKAIVQRIDTLEKQLQAEHPNQIANYRKKIAQYTDYVKTGIAGTNLLRNAQAIAELLGYKRDSDWAGPSENTVKLIDELMTLRLMEQTSENDRQQFAKLVENEPEGLDFALSYLKGQRDAELQKTLEGPAKFNHYKGALPSEWQNQGKLVVVENSQHVRMRELGFTLVGPYRGSSIEEKGAPKSYYFAPEGGTKTAFAQGVIQNVQQTAYGVHLHTGFSTGLNAGVITDPVEVEALADAMHTETSGLENLAPIYGEKHEIVAFERTFNPKHAKLMDQPQNLAKMLGFWRGRQVEEVWATKINEKLVDRPYDMWDKDRNNPTDKDRYVNLFDKKNIHDPVIKDAIRLLTPQTRNMIKERFGDKAFYVRRNMLNQVIGYRQASVGDLWTGNSRYSKETRKHMTNAFIAFFGIDAYRKLVKIERNWQSAMFSVRTNIVIRSIIVPMANFMSGMSQLAARGVPLHAVVRGIPTKIAEIEYYTKVRSQEVKLEAELRANENNIHKKRAIESELQTLKDSLRRLSIWPLLMAGEFSTISDIGQTTDELGIAPNMLIDRLTNAIDKLPAGLRDVARQGYIARDTSLFRVLQKSVQYGDFVMKAIYYDHMMKNEIETAKQDVIFFKKMNENLASGLSKPEAESRALSDMALARITEEFNNYDLPTGRTRGYLESMGMMWFLNYKLRSVKIAASMMRNNPLQAMMLAVNPLSTGTPLFDNVFSQLFDGSFWYSMGPGMIFQPIATNSWYNLVD